jgi:hypothetical protein
MLLSHNLDYENRSHKKRAYREIKISECGMYKLSAILEQRIFQTLMAGLPVAPSEVRIVEVSSTWIRVAWEYPEPNVTFEVTYKTKDSSLHKISNITLHHLEIGELTADAEYQIVVRAANEFGIGMSSLPLVYVNNATANFNFQACFQNCLSLDSSYCISSGVLLLNFFVSILGAMVWCIVAKTEHKRILLPAVKYTKDKHEENTEADCNIYYEIVDNN